MIMGIFKKDDASTLYEKAKEAVEKKEYRKASLLFEKAARMYQKNGEKKLFHRATINAFLYEYKHATDKVYKVNLAAKIIKLLEGIEEIEDLDKPYNTIPASFLKEKLIQERTHLLSVISEKEWSKVKEPQSVAAKIEAEIAKEEKEWENANKLLLFYLRAKSGAAQLKVAERLCFELSKLRKIERFPPLENRYVDVECLINEIKARILEVRAIYEKDFLKRASIYKEAAKEFEKMEEKELYTYKYMNVEGCKESARERFLLNSALSVFWETFSNFYKNSTLEQIKEGFLKARTLFSECSHSLWVKRVNKILENLEKEATCWLCHRKVWGLKVNFNEWSLSLKEAESVPICRVCATILKKLFERLKKGGRV